MASTTARRESLRRSPTARCRPAVPGGWPHVRSASRYSPRSWRSSDVRSSWSQPWPTSARPAGLQRELAVLNDRADTRRRPRRRPAVLGGAVAVVCAVTIAVVVVLTAGHGAAPTLGKAVALTHSPARLPTPAKSTLHEGYLEASMEGVAFPELEQALRLVAEWRPGRPPRRTPRRDRLLSLSWRAPSGLRDRRRFPSRCGEGPAPTARRDRVPHPEGRRRQRHHLGRRRPQLRDVGERERRHASSPRHVVATGRIRPTSPALQRPQHRLNSHQFGYADCRVLFVVEALGHPPARGLPAPVLSRSRACGAHAGVSPVSRDVAISPRKRDGLYRLISIVIYAA